MRLLSALVLTHCFGCIFPEDSDDEVEFQRMHPLRSTRNSLKRNPNTLAANSVDKRYMYQSGIVLDCPYIYTFISEIIAAGDREWSYSCVNLKCIRKYRAHNRRKIKYKYYGFEQNGPIRLYPHSFVFNSKDYSYAQLHGFVPQRGDKGRPMILVSQKGLRSSGNSRYSHRKLLSYSDKDVRKDRATSGRFRGDNAQSQKKGERALAETEGTTEDHSELWDKWGNWSTCSVTCGSGRQVRWRHCLGESCTKGLKKAQMKTCRLKDCESKNILHWLGIKH